MKIGLEVCVDSVESALAASSGGADRIELCSALREGGITPSFGLMQTVRQIASAELCVLVRPRGGDFFYSGYEFAVMLDDVKRARDLGCEAVVIGVLTRDRHVDCERTAALIEAARPMKVTFNRAFDVSRDLERSLEEILSVGADRILTSGGERFAMHGADRIAQLVRTAGDRIVILGGGGLRPSNVAEFVQRSGVREVHTSLRSRTAVAAQHQDADAILGVEPEARIVIRASEVQKLRSALDAVEAGGTEPSLIR